MPKIDVRQTTRKTAIAPKGCKRCGEVKDKHLTPTKCLKVLKLAMEELEQGRGDTYGLFWTFEGNKLCAIDADTGKTVAKFAITATRIPPAFWRGPRRSK